MHVCDNFVRNPAQLQSTTVAMIPEYLLMKWLSVFVVGVMAVGCTKANPKSCKDGLCTDQSFPFCDVDGTLGGEVQECIAVSCTPTEFEACRADRELRCNATGNDYDITQCELGCDAATDGCRLCDPNQTTCTNGKVATCDADGNVVASKSCPLGCFEDQPRCREIDPSNNLAVYLDMVASPPDLDLSNAIFNTDTGEVRVATQLVSVPNFLAPASGTGAAIRVFIANSITLNSASVQVGGDSRSPPGPGIALVARGNVTITGEVIIQPRVGGAIFGCNPGTGSCADDGNGRAVASGGGGGANASDGGSGGSVISSRAGGIQDVASGTVALVPLRGGCSGGFAGSFGPGTYPNGGGAIQISSGTKIDIDATIDVRGATGEGDRCGTTNASMIGGGGAGGSILIEAPRVAFGINAKLLAPGGVGAQGCVGASTYCGAAGTGATASIAASAGADVPYTSTIDTLMMAGGGGGGLGRLRVNTADAVYTKTNTTIEAAVVTTGMLRSR